MKKILAILLALVLLAAGWFFWKGGHHAVHLAQVLEDWLDEDSGAAAVTVQYQAPGHTVDPDTGKLTPQVHQLSLSADGFWTEYADRTLYGLRSGEITAYFHDGNLYLDTGRAYALPDLTGLAKQSIDLIKGLILFGRVTKTDNTYQISMETDELELNVSVTGDRAPEHITLSAIMPDGSAIHAALTPKEPTEHPIPQPVRDAMVRASMEPPMPIMEPLEVLIPALTELEPFESELTMGISCGILELSETVALQIQNGQAKLVRNGVEIDITLPAEFTDISPAAGLLLLRNGTMDKVGNSTVFTVSLPGDATAQLAQALIPQAAKLGISFTESTAILTIHDRALTSISLTAGGSVPFLITEIPVSFSAEFDIQ